MSYWTLVDQIFHMISIMGQVTEKTTNRAIGNALVSITDGPEAFVKKLATVVSNLKVYDESLAPDYAKLLNGSGVSNPDKILAAQTLLKDSRVLRLLKTKRIDQAYTAADGFYYFQDLPPGPYKIEASLPQMGTRYAAAGAKGATAPERANQAKAARLDFVLAPTTITGVISGEAAAPLLGADVRVKGSGEVAYTNSEGTYFLRGIETAPPLKPRTIVVHARGYVPEERPILLTEPGAEVDEDITLHK